MDGFITFQRYKSEFGCTVWPSFESIATQLPEKQWSMASPSAAQRSWNVANVIEPFFGANATARLAEYGEVAFKRQLYQSMISQMLFLKTEMEAWRSSNIWGSTFWMYVGAPRGPLHGVGWVGAPRGGRESFLVY